MQCCGSRRFIPDPDFSRSRIPDPTKKEELNLFLYLFNFLPTKFELGAYDLREYDLREYDLREYDRRENLSILTPKKLFLSSQK